jgi:hypothetical protein
MKRLILGLAFLPLLSCSTQHAPRVVSRPVPAARNFEPQLLKSSHRRSCAITVARENGVKGAGLNLYLDNEQIARIAAGESVTVHVTPGRHRLSVKPLFSPPVGQLLVLEKGDTVKMQIIDQDENYRFMPMGGPWYASIGRSFQTFGR